MLWTMSALGLALMLAPFVLNYSSNSAALWTSLILGAVIALVSGYKAVTKDTEEWENWAAGIAGVLAVFAPYVLGFSGIAAALWTNVILGAAVAILAEAQVSTRQPQTPSTNTAVGARTAAQRGAAACATPRPQGIQAGRR